MDNNFIVFVGSDLKGETEDSKHGPEHGIEFKSFSHKVVQPKSATSSTAGGHTAERTEHGDVEITKDIDAASTKILQAASAGTIYKKVKLYFYRALGGSDSTQSGNKRIDYLTIELDNVLISEVQLNLGHGDERKDGLPVETVKLRYSRIKWTYNSSPLDGSRQRATNVTGGWDLAKNTQYA